MRGYMMSYQGRCCPTSPGHHRPISLIPVALFWRAARTEGPESKAAKPEDFVGAIHQELDDSGFIDESYKGRKRSAATYVEERNYPTSDSL
jgi:hypothetical protein